MKLENLCHLKFIFMPGVFWKASLALKNTKVSITSRERQWDKIPQSRLRAACDGFIGRLKTIICGKGGQFEQI